MTDEKMIEEMARDLKNIKELQAIYKYTPAYFEAQCMFNLGYRKVPENAVVLTRELYDYMIDNARLVEEEIRKETAKKYNNGVVKHIKHLFENNGEIV